MGIITPPNNSLVMGRTSKTDLGLISKDFGTVAKSGDDVWHGGGRCHAGASSPRGRGLPDFG